MALSGFVLLVSGYVAAFGASCWLWGRGVLDEYQFCMLQDTVFVPVQWAGEPVNGFGELCFIKGMGLDVDDFRVDWQDPEQH